MPEKDYSNLTEQKVNISLTHQELEDKGIGKQFYKNNNVKKQIEMKKIFLFTMVSLAFTSCERSNDNTIERPINIQTGIEAITRAPELDNNGKGNFTTGDTFTLTITANTKHVQKDYTVGKTALYWHELGLEGNEVTFAGCYPSYEENENMTFKFNAQNSSNTDLLLAQAVNVPANAKTITMPFYHAMHKLIVKYTSDGSYTQDELNDISTTLYAHTTCTVDLSKGIIVNNSAEMPANYVSKNGKDIFWLIVPQSTNKVRLTITFKGQTKEFTLPTQTMEGQYITALESGKMLTITLQVSKNDISLGNIEIDGWKEQGNAQGDIIM